MLTSITVVVPLVLVYSLVPEELSKLVVPELFLLASLSSEL